MGRHRARSAWPLVAAALKALVVVCCCCAPCASALPSTAHKLRMALSARSNSAHGRALALTSESAGQGQGQGQQQRQFKALAVVVAIKADDTGKKMTCDLELDESSETTALNDALKSVQKCDALHQRLGNGIGACALRDLDSTWVDSIVHFDVKQNKQTDDQTDYLKNNAVPKSELKSDPNAVKLEVWLKAEVLTARVLRAQMGTAVGKTDAPDLSPLTPVACGVFPSGDVRFNGESLKRCGECLHPTIAALQGKQADEVVPFEWSAADVYSVDKKVKFDSNFKLIKQNPLIVLKAPVKFTVHYDDNSNTLQTSAEVWIHQRCVSANKFDAKLLQCLNDRAKIAKPPNWQQLVATGDKHESALTLAADGKAVAWGENVRYWVKGGVVMELMQPLTVLNFPPIDLKADDGKGEFVDQPSSTSQLFVTADKSHTDKTTGSDEAIYLNFASGKFAPDAKSPTKPRADFAEAVFKASGKTYRDEVTPKALYDLLASDGGGSASASRKLKRDLETAHGPGHKHFGFAYFLLRVSYGKSIKPGKHSSWRYVGFLTAADNIKKGEGNMSGPDGAGRHTEQRMMEQLRRFIVALENTAHNGVKLRVTEVQSRWVTDYFPDQSAQNNCDLALQYYERCAKRSTFRDCHYTETVRKAFDSDKWVELTDPEKNTELTTKALKWHPPVGARVYHDGCSMTAYDEDQKKRVFRDDWPQNKCREEATKDGKHVPSKNDEDKYAPKSKDGLSW